MGDERARAVVFTAAYWERIVEQLPLLRAEDRGSVRQSALRNLHSAHHRAVDNMLAGPPGPVPATVADMTAKRYALWTVRRRFDHDDPPGVPADAVAFDNRLRADLWDLDVALRRRLEEVLVAPTLTTPAVSELYGRLAQRMAAVTADIAALDQHPPRHPDWNDADAMLAGIRRDLDRLLVAAGHQPLPPRSR